MVAFDRSNISFSTTLGEYYLNSRKKSMVRGDSKSLVISYIVSLINNGFSRKKNIKIADFGCFNGDFLKQISLLAERSGVEKIECVGFDYNRDILEKAREHYPEIKFEEFNILTDDFSSYYSEFDIIISVNTLHELFSGVRIDDFDNGLKQNKHYVESAINQMSKCLSPGGVFIIFDGIENDFYPQNKVEVNLKTRQAISNFQKFVGEYFLSNKSLFSFDRKDKVRVDPRLLTRFITKNRFINNPTWEFEKEESYQYFTRKEFHSCFKKNGLSVKNEMLLSPNIKKWEQNLEILDDTYNLPFEHLLISAENNMTQN